MSQQIDNLLASSSSFKHSTKIVESLKYIDVSDKFALLTQRHVSRLLGEYSTAIYVIIDIRTITS
jgi:hypothetical protein